MIGLTLGTSSLADIGYENGLTTPEQIYIEDVDTDVTHSGS